VVEDRERAAVRITVEHQCPNCGRRLQCFKDELERFGLLRLKVLYCARCAKFSRVAWRELPLLAVLIVAGLAAAAWAW
jgi:hypothetical protein